MPSALEEYSRNYGQHLRSILDGGGSSALVQDPNAPRGSPNGMPDMGDANPMVDRMRRRELGSALESGEGAYIEPPVIPMEAGGTADPSGGQDMGGPMAQPQLASELPGGEQTEPGSAIAQAGEGGGGYGFRDMWKDAPDNSKKRELDKLEENLKRGNQTIDQAYDELEKSLGTPPEKRRKLTREEKGMLLLEFGMNMLANSRQGLGAIGIAGGQAIKGYRDLAEEDYNDYKKSKKAVDLSRAGAKVDLAKQSAIEGLRVTKEQALRLPGRFTGEDGTVYFYDEAGQVKQALDEKGRPIKGELKGDGSGGRGFESDAKYNRYMEIYGVDDAGNPLTGLALQKVKQEALDFANDRGNSIDDLDLDILAEKSADDEMKADAYRDLTPEQREARRSEIAAARRKRLVRPDRRRSALEATPGPKKRFRSEADARAAFKRGEIRKGDMIIVNGVEGAVE